MASDEVERLRREVKKKRAAVGNKIARLKREHGANVAGSEYDPRRAAGAEKRYNKPQLQRHLEELNGFMHRSVQFSHGADGPIKRGTFNTLKRLSGEVQAAQAEHAGRIDNLEAPLMGDSRPGERGQTVGQQRNMLHAKADGGVKGPYSSIDFNLTDVANEKAANKLIADMRKQLKSGFLPGKLNEGKDQLNKALHMMGEEGFVARVDALSDAAFDALWYGSAFAELTFMKYDLEQARLDGTRKERWQDRIVDNAYEDIDKHISWAEDLDKAEPGENTGLKR